MRHFWSQIKTFVFFCERLLLNKFEGADFKYDNSFLKILAQKSPNKAFSVPNLGILLFHEILQLDKFEDDDFEYDNNLFKFEPKNTQTWHFWSHIKGFLVFEPNFATRQIAGH